MNQRSEVVKFPGIQEARALVPAGRRPYMKTRQVFAEAPHSVARERKAVEALIYLAETQSQGIIDPPLTEAMEHDVLAASLYVDQRGIPEPGFDMAVVETIFEAVIEHGYRNPEAYS